MEEIKHTAEEKTFDHEVTEFKVEMLQKELKKSETELSSALESYNRECKRNGELQEQLAYCHGRMNEAYNEIRSEKEAMTLIVKVNESQKEEIELYREALTETVAELKSVLNSSYCGVDDDGTVEKMEQFLSKHQPIKKDENR
jgi:uncharacterized membrane protein YheB (UPF0754 family)